MDITRLPAMVQRKGRIVLYFEWLSQGNLHFDVHPSENVQSIDWSMDCLQSAKGNKNKKRNYHHEKKESRAVKRDCIISLFSASSLGIHLLLLPLKSSITFFFIDFGSVCKLISLLNNQSWWIGSRNIYTINGRMTWSKK